MRRWVVFALLMLLDSVLVALALCLALVTGSDGAAQYYFAVFPRYLAVAILICLPVFHIFGLYHRMWRYASVGELLAIAGAGAVSSTLVSLYAYIDHAGLSASVLVMNFFYVIALTGASRLFISVMQKRPVQGKKPIRVLVVGAGDPGILTAWKLELSYGGTKVLAGFVDDDPGITNKLVRGYRVLGTSKDIKELVYRHKIDEIIIAITPANTNRLREVIIECLRTRSSVKISPHPHERLEDVNVAAKVYSADASVAPDEKIRQIRVAEKPAVWLH